MFDIRDLPKMIFREDKRTKEEKEQDEFNSKLQTVFAITFAICILVFSFIGFFWTIGMLK